MDDLKQCFILGLILTSLACGFSVPLPVDDEDRDVRVAPDINGTTPHPNVTQPPTHPPLTLRQRYVTKDGRLWTTKPLNESSVRIEATNLVLEESMKKAGRTVAGMVKYMPQAIFNQIAASHGVRIFPIGHGMSVYPEMAVHAITPQCRATCAGSCRVTCLGGGGRKIDYLAGLTGRYSYVSEASIYCKNDGYYGLLNTLAHEFSHLIMFNLPAFWRGKIFAAYNLAKSKVTWAVTSYAMSSRDEYWAEATGAFYRFDKLPYSTTGGMSKFADMLANRAFLKQQDPEIYAVLEYVFTENHPEINEHVWPCM